MTDPHVLIVGAGPSGLALANELSLLGVSYRLIDRSPQPAQWSQAVVVHARTLERFAHCGIADAAIARGSVLRKATLFNEREVLAEVDFESVRSPYPFVLMLPQSETERLLSENLAVLGGQVERQRELMRFEQQEEGIFAAVWNEAGKIEHISASWIVGCDGAHSTVRKEISEQLQGNSIAAFETKAREMRLPFVDLTKYRPDSMESEIVPKHIAMRYNVLPIKKEGNTLWVAMSDPNDLAALDDLRLVARCQIKAVISAPDHIKNSLDQLYPGSLFFLGDVRLIGPNVPGDELRIYLDESGISLIARLSETIWRVMVLPKEEQQVRGSDDRILTLQDLQAAIDSCIGPGIEASDPTWLTRFRANPHNAWTYGAGRAFLAGDAVHTSSPMIGLGMNRGIQNAANLAWEIASIGQGTPEELLDSYEEECVKADRIQWEATVQAMISIHSSDAVRAAIMEHALGILGSLRFI